MRTINRTITRETPDRDSVMRDVLQVRLEPGSKCLYIKPKGKRTWRAMRYADIFRIADLAAARAANAAKVREKYQARMKARVPR